MMTGPPAPELDFDPTHSVQVIAFPLTVMLFVPEVRGAQVPLAVGSDVGVFPPELVPPLLPAPLLPPELPELPEELLEPLELPPEEPAAPLEPPLVEPVPLEPLDPPELVLAPEPLELPEELLPPLELSLPLELPAPPEPEGSVCVDVVPAQARNKLNPATPRAPFMERRWQAPAARPEPRWTENSLRWSFIFPPSVATTDVGLGRAAMGRALLPSVVFSCPALEAKAFMGPPASAPRAPCRLFGDRLSLRRPQAVILG
jgi:hypothetical protein